MPETKVLLAEVPIDSLVRIEPEGASIVVIRTRKGIFAYQDRCPHAYWPLSQGAVTNGVLECPGHGWEFDVETGRCLNAAAYCLSPVVVTPDGPHVHLEWKADAVDAPAMACEESSDQPTSS
jgi:nitrite reductase/ring-hydroxylating ferredoxin subunit